MSKTFFPSFSSHNTHTLAEKKMRIRQRSAKKSNSHTTGQIYEKTFYLSVVQPPTVTKTSTRKKKCCRKKTLSLSHIEGRSDYFCEWLCSFRTCSLASPFTAPFFAFLVYMRACVCVCVHVFSFFFTFCGYDLLKYRKKKNHNEENLCATIYH